jgi:hypothetical protein
MVECIRSHIRTQPESNITKFYYRLAKKKKGNAKATVAASSKLLKIVYWIMKEKTEYRTNDNKQASKQSNMIKSKKERIKIVYYG